MAVVIVWLLIPMKLFNNQWSAVLYDSDNNILAAQVAADGQWRLPPDQSDSIPQKYKTCLLEFEDKRFHYHMGVDPVALIRAGMQNIHAGKVVSGGSTISMQVMRMSRQADSRSILQKLLESILALKLEIRHSKEDILNLYASHAPYGGNIVGIKAASWRYFGRSPYNLTWAESALLAVLPNAPASIHMNRNREMLKAKRNRLLSRLYQAGKINKSTWQLAMDEEIPSMLRPFPNKSIHLLHKLKKQHPTQTLFHASIHGKYQEECMNIMQRHALQFRKNGINNACAVIAETKTGKVRAYVGNTGLYTNEGENSYVDIPSSRRSSGSVLKPLLYAHMLSRGEIMPGSLVPDYPVHFGSYAPENFNLQHDGAVPAARCIARSLNVPAVHLLKKHGIAVFIDDLQHMGFSTINRSADNYGLSLILGSAEVRPDELCAAYASMGRRLLDFQEDNAMYRRKSIHPLLYLEEAYATNLPSNQSSARMDAAGIWHAFEAMKNVKRPDGKGNWRYFNSEQAIAWKTGTSYGFRDAWAVGVTPDFTVCVWVGNADGEGRPGLLGLKTAAPVLFDIFDMLPAYQHWFRKPYDAMVKMPVCSKSGYLASSHCPQPDSLWIPKAAYHFEQCPYHQLMHFDSSGTYRVNASCYAVDKMISNAVYILPPAMEWYYRQHHPDYSGKPEWHPNCKAFQQDGSNMQIIYPNYGAEIYVPTELDGKQQRVVFKAAHQNQDATVFWSVDDKYCGKTTGRHQLSFSPDPGEHMLILTDEHGHKAVHKFTVLNKRK